MWVAKDKDGTIYLFDKKPVKINADIGDGKTISIWSNDDGESMELCYDGYEFNDLISWEDDEPIEVELVKKMRYVDDKSVKLCDNCKFRCDYPKCFKEDNIACEDWELGK